MAIPANHHLHYKVLHTIERPALELPLCKGESATVADVWAIVVSIELFDRDLRDVPSRHTH